MGHDISNIGQKQGVLQNKTKGKDSLSEDFVLEKSIFNNIFEKDIRRVFIYKKAERLAKAIHLIAPAFADSVSLRNKIDSIAVGLVEAATLPSGSARMALSRELLALSSVLGIARTGGLLSYMNTELITREAHALLQEVAAYEEPRLFLDEAPTLSGIAKQAYSQDAAERPGNFDQKRAQKTRVVRKGQTQLKDSSEVPPAIKDRRETIMSIIRDKGSVSIKDISTIIRGVSEKTVQRELIALIQAKMIKKQGERRWSTYSLA
jgi:hypothetical protein